MTRRLHFVVIGAQKAGTTTLWQLLRDHPQLAFPPAKEAPFFTEESYARGLEWYLRTAFADAPAARLLGSVTPQYTMGTAAAPVPVVAGRMARDAPGVRLVALLRDPVERALSQWTMSRRWGVERRPVEVALREELAPGALEAARATPSTTNSYVAQGEYGRTLATYLRHFPREQLHVELTTSLERDPGAVVQRVLAFVGADHAWRPERLGERWFRGGERPRVPPDASQALLERLGRDVFPLAGAAQEDVAAAFWLVFQQWNVVPEPHPTLPPELEAALREHFARDATAAERLLGVALPWSRGPQVPAASG